MYLIVGIGNPGKEYDNSRHNIGFRAVDKLADRIGLKLGKRGFNSLYNIGSIREHKLLIIKPQTFMNNSGVAVKEAKQFYKIEDRKIIIIHDEMDLPLEKIKVKKNGGSAGHNGIKSIVQHLGTGLFPRVRIGVGKPVDKNKGVNHVLSAFTKEEKSKIDSILDRAIDAVEKIIVNGIEKAMNEFNIKSVNNIETN